MIEVVSVHEPAPGVLLDRDEAIGELFREHYRSLLRLAALLVDDRETAEDVVQDAFVRLHGAWGRVRDPAQRPAYLRSIVCNTARSRLRRRLVAARHRPAPPADARSAEDAALVGEERAEVLAALRALPRRQRECLVLRYYLDLSEAQIAAALGISTGSVKSHASRGVAALAAALEGRP